MSVKYGNSGGIVSKTAEWMGIILICLVVSSVVSWHFFTWYGNHIEELYRYQRDLLAGHPPWIATQNRVLAPYLIECLMNVRGKDFAFTYNHFMHLTFVFVSISVAVLCRSHRLDLASTVMIILSISGIMLLMFNYWWFPWTNIELALLCLSFAAMTIERRFLRVAIVGALFLLMCFNKETAVFLPFWLIVVELARYYFDRSEPVIELVKRLAVFAAMILVSLKLTSFLRRELFVSGNTPGLESGVIGGIPQFLGNNIEILGEHAWARVIDTLDGLVAMIWLKNPMPLFGNKYWADWSQPQLFFWACFIVSIVAALKTFLAKDAENFAIALVCVAYAVVVAALSNPAEMDKMIGFFAFGLLYVVRKQQSRVA